MPKPTATTLIKEIEDELMKVKLEVKDLDYKIKSLQEKAHNLEETLKTVENKLIPPTEWDIVKKIVFGVVALALIAVFSAIIGKVVIS